MPDRTEAVAEPQFLNAIETLAADPNRRQELNVLLKEQHPFYTGRGSAAIVRMRGWILLTLARSPLSETSLPLVLEELDTGSEPYLLAAAARALQAAPAPSPTFAPMLVDALKRIRYRDDPVALERYGEYAVGTAVTSPVRELLAALAWMGPAAASVAADLASVTTTLPKKHRSAALRALSAISKTSVACCSLSGIGRSWILPRSRLRREGVDAVVFEDQDGSRITFRELFTGQPSIVVFFYTRCDNPLKCSLSISKLATIQKLLAARGLASRVRTAAITYDPAFDLPGRLRRYGEDRGVHFDARNRMLRAPDGLPALRGHFQLGVNFIQSLVNRHRIELFVLDPLGRVAAVFERIRWDEQQVVECAAGLLNEPRTTVPSGFTAPLAALALALLPKCPFCWTAYLSALGIAGVQIPYPDTLEPILFLFLLLGVVSVGLQARRNRCWMAGALLVFGAGIIIMARLMPVPSAVGLFGVALTTTGSLWSALRTKALRVTA